MRKLLVFLTLFVCLISTSVTSYAEESQDDLIQKQMIMQDKLVALRDTTQCQVVYYNFALYFVVAENIAKDFRISEKNRKPLLKIYESSKDKYNQFRELSKELMKEGVEIGIPWNIIQQTEFIGQRMATDQLGALSNSLFEDPTYGDVFFDSLIVISNQCDSLLK
jgi:hypothetical protein